MNRSEKIVHDYLNYLSNDIIYEPFPNEPPDFLVDKRLAIEVRTLNQIHFDGQSNKSLE